MPSYILLCVATLSLGVKDSSAEGKRLCQRVPCFLDAGPDAYTDVCLGCPADDTLRFRRAMMRDGVGEEAVRARMQHQMLSGGISSACRLPDI